MVGKFSNALKLVSTEAVESNGSKLDEAIASVSAGEIPTSKIHRCRWQPPGRHSEEELETFGKSVDAIGITDPIIVRPHPDIPGEYELLNGDKRWTVAQRKGMEAIPARVIEANDEIAHAIFAAGLMHSTKPTELQEVDIILSHLSMRLNSSIEEVVSMLRQGFDEERGRVSTSNVAGKDVWQQLMSEYAAITSLSLGTFCTHRLRWLNVPPDVLAAVREGKLPANNAKAIAQVKDEADRKALLKEAIAEKLSVSQIRERVKAGKPEKEEVGAIARVKDLPRRVKASRIGDDPVKRKKLEELLSQIDELLG